MRVRGGWKGVQEQSILGGLIFRTRRRAHDLQVIGKVSSRVDVRIYLVSEVTGMSSLRNDTPPGAYVHVNSPSEARLRSGCHHVTASGSLVRHSRHKIYPPPTTSRRSSWAFLAGNKKFDQENSYETLESLYAQLCSVYARFICGGNVFCNLL